MNQFDIMAELAADSSSWIDIAHYPPTSLCRKILLLADFAADDPLRWNVCRTLFEHPELSRREISALFSSGTSTIQRKTTPVPIGDGDPLPSQPGVFPAGHHAAPFMPPFSLSYRRTCRLCNFSAGQPVRWKAIRLAYTGPRMAQKQIAEICGVCVRTIRTYLAPVNLSDPGDFLPIPLFHPDGTQKHPEKYHEPLAG